MAVTIVMWVVSVVLLLVHVFGAVRALCSGSTAQACKRALRRGRCGVKKEPEEADDELKVEIQKEVERRRLAYARRGFGVLSAVGCALLARGLLVGFSGTTNPQTMAGRIVGLAMLCCTAARAAKPDLLSARTLNTWHLVFMAALTFHASPLCYESTDALEFNSSIYVLLGIFCSTLNLTIRLSFATNLLLSTSVIYTCATRPGNVDVLVFAARELVFFVAKVALLYWVEVLLESSIEQEVKAKSLRSHKSATTSLLQRMCDAVAEVDIDLRFVEHSPSLASMLFHGPGKSHKGAPMKDLLQSDDDRALFASSLAACSSKDGAQAAGMLHANLRDSWGSAVGVEIFHVAYPAPDEQVRHLVGLKGQQDKEPVSLNLDHLCEACRQALSSQGVMNAQHSSASAGEPGAEARFGAGLGSGGSTALLRDFVTEGVVQRQRSTARSRSRSASTGASSRRDNNVAVDVVAAESLPLVYSSPKFVAKYGSVSTFAELVPHEAHQIFQHWVSQTADEVWSGTRRAQMEEYGHMTVSAAAAVAPPPSKITVLFPQPKPSTSRADYSVSIRVAKSMGASGNATGTRGTLATPGAHGDLTHADLQAPSTSDTQVCL